MRTTHLNVLAAVVVLSFPVFAHAQSSKAALAADPQRVTVQSGSCWVRYRGETVLLVGDSITQGWMELGTSFDQVAYLDALAKRGINATLLWSYIGVTDQPHDPRIGYDSPEIWPWNRRGEKFDLASFNEEYFQRLRKFLDLAHERKIVVILTVHDGWTKTRFAGHPFNAAKGGWLKNRSEYVRLGRPGTEMPKVFDETWSNAEKHQYALERFCERLLTSTGDAPNVMFELFNEGEWYRRKEWEAFQRHFATFFRTRSNQPVLVNDDQREGKAFRAEGNVDLLSFHMPQWEQQPPARTFFELFARQRTAQPVKPVLFTEPVPEYQGGMERDDAILQLLWGTALGGSGILFQNDTSWGFDVRTTMAKHATDRDRVLDYEGLLCRFMNSGKLDIQKFTPAGSLVSSGVCIAKTGEEYLAFYDRLAPEATLDLRAAPGKNFTVTWYDPRTGKSRSEEKIAGGENLVFQVPFPNEGVLHLKQAE
ncbi:MAG: putative collagen-binding domain-containing protein [Planctomycetales bacterium]